MFAPKKKEKMDDTLDVIQRLNNNDPTLTMLILDSGALFPAYEPIPLEQLKKKALGVQIREYLDKCVEPQVLKESIASHGYRTPCFVRHDAHYVALIDALQHNQTLSILVINRWTMPADHGLLLGRCFVLNKKLRTLFVHKSDLGLRWGLHLKNSRLWHIYVYKTFIGFSSGLSLASGLGRRSRNKLLSITACGMAQRTNTAIMDGLVANTTLKKLTLDGFPIQSEGGVAFGRSLFKKSQLKYMTLRNSFMDNVTVAPAVLDALRVNTSLVSLTLFGLDDDIAEHMRDALVSNRTITTFKTNLSPSTCKTQILNLIRRNRKNGIRRTTTFTELLITHIYAKKK